jgi:POT family proton-dependent oligopeptide transporter
MITRDCFLPIGRVRSAASIFPQQLNEVTVRLKLASMTTQEATAEQAAKFQKDLSHPKGLYVLFFAELWERFSYYGMRALLMLYMTFELLYTDHRSYGIYGAYGALVYGAPVIGGYLADRYLGNRRAIYLGGFIIALGHFTLAMPGNWSLFYGISFIIIGTGFFKANVSTLVGQLYKKGDPRRDSGFTIFYMGINMGGFLAPLICGTIGEKFGWHYGFGLAGLGMLVGMLVLFWGADVIKDIGHSPVGKKLDERKYFGLSLFHLTILVSLCLVPLLVFLIDHNEVLGHFLQFFGLAVLSFILVLAFKSQGDERRCLLTLLMMLPFYMCFFACLEQAGGSMNLFAARNVDRFLWGKEIKITWFQSVNPLFIVTLAPVFSSLWSFLGRRGKDLLTPTKFSLGLAQAGIGFGCLLIGISQANSGGYTSMIWLILAYFFNTTGEICLSPVGLSMVTKLSPPKFCSLMMGSLMLSISFAQYIAALIAKTFGGASQAIELTKDRVLSLVNFNKIFEVLFIFPLVAAVLVLAIGFIPAVRQVFIRHQ